MKNLKIVDEVAGGARAGGSPDGSLNGSPDGELANAGGRVWLNFVNTEALATQGMADVLGSASLFEIWLSSQVPGFGGADLSWVGPDELARFGQFRDYLTRLVLSVEQSGDADLGDLNAVLSRQRVTSRLELAAGGYELVSMRHFRSADEVLGPLAESAAATLAEGRFDRLRKCERHDCSMHFFDDSKNGRRRWCTMGLCGNRSKAARHYAREKARGQVALVGKQPLS